MIIERNEEEKGEKRQNQTLFLDMYSVPHPMVSQNWNNHSNEEHLIWKTLYHRQLEVLKDRSCIEFLKGLDQLGIISDQIPNFDNLNDILYEATKWSIVPVPGLVPDDVFFRHLANREFPSTCFIRTMNQLDYLEAPDCFHDIFGHSPLLINPIFADAIQEYGKIGLKSLETDSLKYLARWYWYTVEFGLIKTSEGLRIYGSGILSSKGETIYCLENLTPNRIKFDLYRIMRTNYEIDSYQKNYFVIDNFQQLFDSISSDFDSVFQELKPLLDLRSDELIIEDQII